MTPYMQMHLYIQMRLANKSRGEFYAEGNVLWLYDAIAGSQEEADWLGGVAPVAFIEALRATTGPVTLRINSPGGSVFGAQAMIAAMREHPHPITARVDSLAASAASVIAAEAATMEMTPGSKLMIHKAWAGDISNSDGKLAIATLLEKIDGDLAASYARRANGDAATFLDLMRAETWFTADEAVAVGLADRVITENRQRPAAAWDLSAFVNAPATPEPEPVHDMRAHLGRQLAVKMALHPV
jgi:ATP-dependent Clp protease protease subunit